MTAKICITKYAFIAALYKQLAFSGCIGIKRHLLSAYALNNLSKWCKYAK